MSQKVSDRQVWNDRIKEYQDIQKGLSSMRALNDLLFKLNITKENLIPPDWQNIEVSLYQSYRDRVRKNDGY